MEIYSLSLELSWTTAATFISLLLAYFWMQRKNVTNSELPGKKKVPIVSGGFPLIGHGLWAYWDLLSFLNNCYAKYGGIFQIKIFLANIVVICDRRLVPAYFEQKEDSLSLTRVVEMMNFDWTLFELEILRSSVRQVLFKKAVTLNNNLTLSNIHEEGERIVENLKLRCTKDGAYECVLNEEFNEFIIRTTLAGILGMPFNDNFYCELKKFYKFADKMVQMSYIIPKWLLKLTCHWRIRKFRKSFIPHFESEIQKYADDPSKIDSILIRSAVDLEVNKRKLSKAEIVQVIIGFMHSGSKNTALALSNALIYAALPENSTKLSELRQACENCSSDLQRLLADPMLNGWVLESARLSTQLFSIQRVPMRPVTTLMDYHIGSNVDYLALSGLLLQVYGDAGKVYHDPTHFIPERFIGPKGEPQTTPNIVIWGGGGHACPGRTFSINQVKIALAQLLINFDYEIEQEVPDFDYTSVDAFGRKNVTVRMCNKKSP